MPLTTITPITSADLPTLSTLVHASKLTLTINRLLFTNWPNDAAQRPQYAAAVEFSFHNPAAECLKAVDEGGEIVGYMVLARRRPAGSAEVQGGAAEAETETEEEAEEKGAGEAGEAGETSPISVPEGMNPTVFSAIMNASAQLAKETAEIDHFEITFLLVPPAARRRGIASQLVQRGFARARAAGIPLAATAEPAAYAFFAALAFQETRHVDFDLAQWAQPYTGFGLFRLAAMMWRPEPAA